jgi:Flp pilus assembly protein TadG
MRRIAYRRDESGAAAIEFALVLPPLLLVVFGIVNFGLAYHQQIQLSGAAREGARTMAITDDPALTIAAVQAAAPTLNGDEMDIGITPGSCASDAAVTVTVNYPFTFQYLFGSADIDLSGVGVMRCNG